MHSQYSEGTMEASMLTAEFNFMLCNNLNKYSAFENSKTVLEMKL